jgi:integrase/recombinase XerD
VQGERNRSDLAFHEVTVRFLADYESYLKTTLENAVSTVHTDLGKIQAIFNVAVSRDLLPFADNPFLKFKSQFKEAKKKKERLTADEVRAIKELDLTRNTLIWNVRNSFLLSFYTGGLRIGDLLDLRWRNIRAGRLDFMMEKTDKDRSVLLLPPAQDIIDRYVSEERRSDHFIFPFLDLHADYSGVGVLDKEKERKTALINKYLKKIAKAAGISKTLSSHLARHSAADLLRKSGTSVFDISKILGHSKISVTEAYLESLDRESMDHEMGKLGEI